MATEVSYSWEVDLRAWVRTKKLLPAELTDGVCDLFALAFEHTRCLEHAWFGVQQQSASLVVGGIWLAAINLAMSDRGVWLLLDQPDFAVAGVELSPVKSTKRFATPLTWAHCWPPDSLVALISTPAVWTSFARATERILEAPIARGHEDLLRKRGKRRLAEFWRPSNTAQAIYPDDIPNDEVFPEGASRQVSVNAYERNSEARRRCIAHYGTRCCVCKLDFAEMYGEIGRGFIHIHHLKPLSEVGHEYQVDPIADLRPVCPNCHAMIHRRNPAYSIEEVRAALQRMEMLCFSRTWRFPLIGLA